MITVDPYGTGQKIKALMKERNISVNELSDKLGFTTTHAVYKWFRGENLPTLDNLVAIAHILEVSMDYIVAVKAYEEYRIPRKGKYA